MRTRSAFHKDDLLILKSDKVLDVGSGSNPTKRANVLLEKHINNNEHRRGDLKIFLHQTLVEGDGSNMPFKDNEFDYSICSHVLEHVSDPEKFIKELMRVSKRGYIETPSLIGEILAPKKAHKWVVLNINNKLVFFEKSLMPYSFNLDMGDLFLNYLPYHSIAYRLFVMTRNNYHAARIEWIDSFQYSINPSDDYLKSFFIKKLTPQMVEQLLPPLSIKKDFSLLLNASFVLLKEKIRRHFDTNLPVDYEHYIKLNN